MPATPGRGPGPGPTAAGVVTGRTRRPRSRIDSRGWDRELLLGAALALAACGGAAPATTTSATPPTVTRHPSGVLVHHDTTCSPYDAIAERQRTLDARYEAALARALAEANLTEASYQAEAIDGRDGGPWEVVEADGRRDLLSPDTQVGCSGRIPWRLALDGRGGVVALDIRLREVARHEFLTCGCPGEVGPTGCGGMAQGPARVRWALPAGVDFAGSVSVTVDYESSLLGYAGRADRAPCPVERLQP